MTLFVGLSGNFTLKGHLDNDLCFLFTLISKSELRLTGCGDVLIKKPVYSLFSIKIEKKSIWEILILVYLGQ